MKAKTKFVCNECGYETVKWMGKCPECGSWNSMSEFKELPPVRGGGISNAAVLPLAIDQVALTTEERLSTGSQELDRVLGGGAVKGSLILVGGDPGIGKSTLLLQVCNYLSRSGPVLYVSGEESQKQIKMRAQRLGALESELYVLSETNTAQIQKAISEKSYSAVVIDSIQTMYDEGITSAPGSVSQVREATLLLMRIAKEQGITVFVVGHVTKEGSLAGPRVLEHMVDCVLYFEGDSNHAFRILRGVKNRFGSTNEIGVFSMNETGLSDVPNPSSLFLEDRAEGVPGSCVFCSMEGSRPILSEIQALVTKTAFGLPRRTASGLEHNRVVLQIAVLEKRLGLPLSSADIYTNVAGGIRLDEPAADLALCLAVASGFKNKPGIPKSVVFGEVGLTGELRGVSFAQQRIKEAKKLGFEHFIIPKSNLSQLTDTTGVYGAADLSSAVEHFFY